MPIDFDAARWKKTKDTYAKWWDGKLGRPLFNVTVSGRDPGRAEPKLPKVGREAAYDFKIPAEDVIDRWDYDLSCQKFVGDSFPHEWPNFGPGVVAAFLGARPAVDATTVWFHPPKQQEVTELHFSYIANHPWVKRIADIITAAQKRWHGMVQVGMTDLGGPADLLATFRPSEQIMMDFYDHPEDVKRVIWELHHLWWKYFDYLDGLQKATNPGYSSWTAIYSQQPSYMFQCDVAYMISPAMFEEFIKPELAASFGKVPHAFYHLDGIGQLRHLDSLLSLDTLRGIQWVPGAGQNNCQHWPEVYRKIYAAGKRTQFFLMPTSAGGLEIMDILADQVGAVDNAILIGTVPAEQEGQLMKVMEKYGAA